MTNGSLCEFRYFSVRLSRWQRFKRLFTWSYIRQTRLLLPLTEWWINR